MMTSTLKDIVRVLDNAATKDATRSYLQCCHIEKDKIVATDGHIMAIINHYDSAFSHLDDKALHVHRDQLPFLKLILKGAKNQGAIPSVINNTQIILEGRVITTEGVNFPNYKNFIPNYGDDVLRVGLSSELLLKLVKALSDTSSTGCELRFKKNYLENGDVVEIDKSTPIEVISNHNGNIGVLMPMRI